MTARRLAAVDAQTFWMSAHVPNDQFVLYVFAGIPDGLDGALAAVLQRARACTDLTLRIVDDCRWRYPKWVADEVDPAQIVVHDGDVADWDACLAAVAYLADDQLDPRIAAWRLHVFLPVQGVPGSVSAVAVAVLQISHALADGTRAAELAAWLLGRESPVAPIAVARHGSLLLRTVAAARTHRAMARDIEAGRLPGPREAQPPLPTNAAPTGACRLRTLVRHRSELTPGPTVTVAVLVAIAAALDGYLRDRGADPPQLQAEVLIAKSGTRLAHNHFRNVGVGLHPELGLDARAAAISADLQAGRARGQHPALVAADLAFAATPAPLLRWGVGQFDPAARSPTVTGATAVSSVNRGPADLHLGTAPVVWTSGYPALSPMMGLTHGVHGIGEMIAVSVHGAESAVDIDDYVGRLDAALRASG
ncbi:hypothetical protein BH09ACT7_BH09ACT7_56560 [soil metagenome]